MKSDDRRLCYEFLMRACRRSKSSAKTYFESLGESRRCLLLEHATEWVSMGRPTREDRERELATSLPASGAIEEVVAAAPVALEPAPSKGRVKKTLFSLMLPPDDLDQLRDLSERTGEAVAYHVREAIRRYLKETGESI